MVLLNTRSAKVAAKDLLELTDQATPPVNLNEVLGRFGEVRVSESDLEGDGVFVDLGTIGAEILVKRSAPYFRKRFTIAHELGHYILSKRNLSFADEKMIERWCNVFAANLLMPEEAFVRYINTVEAKPLNIWAQEIYVEGRKIFDVSMVAFLARYSELTKKNIYIIDEPATGQFKIMASGVRAGTDVLLWNSQYFELVEMAKLRAGRSASSVQGTVAIRVLSIPRQRGRWIAVLALTEKAAKNPRFA